MGAPQIELGLGSKGPYMCSRMVFSSTAQGWGLLEPYGYHSPAPQSSPVLPGGHRHCPVTRWQGTPTQEQEPEQLAPNVPAGHSVGESSWASVALRVVIKARSFLWSPRETRGRLWEQELSRCESREWSVLGHRKRQGQGCQKLRPSRTLESSQEQWGRHSCWRMVHTSGNLD